MNKSPILSTASPSTIFSNPTQSSTKMAENDHTDKHSITTSSTTAMEKKRHDKKVLELKEEINKVQQSIRECDDNTIYSRNMTISTLTENAAKIFVKESSATSTDIRHAERRNSFNRCFQRFDFAIFKKKSKKR